MTNKPRVIVRLASLPPVYLCRHETDNCSIAPRMNHLSETNHTQKMSIPTCYCAYCGRPFKSVSELTRAGLCTRHPDGPVRGGHKLYEGSEKAVYTCKYCGAQERTIDRLTSSFCVHHPKGHNRGRHAPAL